MRVSPSDQFPVSNRAKVDDDALLEDVLLKRLWRSALSENKNPSENNAAKAELLRCLQDTIFRFCCVQLNNRDAAQEATAETALRILKTFDRYQAASKVKTWVLGIALNVCREQRNQKKRDANFQMNAEFYYVENHEQENVLEVICKQETSTQMMQLINQLPPRQKEAIVLRYFEAMSTAETAKVMKVASGTIKATVANALQNLRAKLSEDNTDGPL